MTDVKEKLTVVTGCATGIGAAITKAFSDGGALVVGIDIQNINNNKALGYQFMKCDLTNPEMVVEVFKNISAEYGDIDILINNAALASSIKPKPLDKITAHEWSEVISKNTLMPLLCSQQVIPGMRKKNGAGL